MLELNISQNNNTYTSAYGKYFARVEYKKTMSIDDMAKHMAEHNTPFSVGTIAGILKDFVSCTREQCLNGNTVKIDNLAIFKCSVEGNGMKLGENYKISCGLGGRRTTKNPDGHYDDQLHGARTDQLLTKRPPRNETVSKFVTIVINRHGDRRWWCQCGPWWSDSRGQ